MAQQALRRNGPAANAPTNWLGIVRGIITEPSATFAALADTQAWRQGLASAMLVWLVTGVIGLASPTPDAAQSGPVAALLASPFFKVGGQLILGPVLLFLATGLLYQIGLRQGGDGPFARLFTTEAFISATIGLVGAPLLLIAALAQRSLGDGVSWLSSLVSVGTGIWSVVLTIFSLRAAMRLGTGGAIVTLLLSVVASIVLIGLAFCVVGAVFAA